MYKHTWLQFKWKIFLKKISYILGLETEVNIIIDCHMDELKLSRIRKAFKIKMSKYEIISNYSAARGVAALVEKRSGYTLSNVKLIDITNTLQFDLNAPDSFIYNVVAIYAPNGDDSTYWINLQQKVATMSEPNQILIDFNTTLDPHLESTIKLINIK